MKIVQLKCPNCGASLEAEDNLETFFCKYCGQKIILAEQSNAQIGAKVFGKLLDHREKMHQMKAEEERIRRAEQIAEKKRADRIVWIGIICMAGLSLILLLLSVILR